MRTSQTHPLQIAEVRPAAHMGRIGLTFCPGKKQPHAATGAWDRDVDTDVQAIRDWGAAVVVTLIEDHEIAALQVQGLGAAVQAQGMDWLHLPIPDVSVPGPAFETLWTRHGPALRAQLRAGQAVLVHCKGGLGRAGTIASRLMIELGVPPKTAVTQVRTARPGAIETPAQLAYVMGQKPVPHN